MSTETQARHRVALAGFVCDSLTKLAIPGADVVITGMPAAFTTRLSLYKAMLGKYAMKSESKWNTMAERPDRTRSGADGSFRFLDLPDGEYILTVSAPAYGARYGAADLKITIPRTSEDKTAPEWPVLSLPPTAVQGAITSKKTNVSYAHVRVQGTGESAITNKAGQFLITQLEPGRRTLLVNAQGYKAMTQDIVISAPGVAQVVNFNLVPDKA